MLEVFLSALSGVRTSDDMESRSLLGSARATWRTAPLRTSFSGASSPPGEYSGLKVAGDEMDVGTLAADAADGGAETIVGDVMGVD